MKEIPEVEAKVKDMMRLGQVILNKYPQTFHPDNPDSFVKEIPIRPGSEITDPENKKIYAPNMVFQYRASINMRGSEYFSIDQIKEKYPNTDFSRAFIKEIGKRFQTTNRISSVDWSERFEHQQERSSVKNNLKDIGIQLEKYPEKIINEEKIASEKDQQVKQLTLDDAQTKQTDTNKFKEQYKQYLFKKGLDR